MAKDSDRIDVPFDSAPLLSEEQDSGNIPTSRLSNLQMLESFYAERMEMLSRTRQRYFTQNTILNMQLNFENALMAATSLSFGSVLLSGCGSDYVVEGLDDVKVQENQEGVVLTHLILKRIREQLLGDDEVTTVDPSKYTVHINDPSGKFEIRDGQVALKQGESLDYEALQAQGVDFLNVTITITSNTGSFTSFTKSFNITVLDDVSDNIKLPPTDMTLPTTIIQEDAAGFALGKLSVVDPNNGNTFTFTLEGKDTGRTLFIRDKFEVDNGVLELKDGKSLSYSDNTLNIKEIMDDGGTFIIKVTARDQGGLSFTKEFTIILNDKPQANNDILTMNEGAVLPTISPLSNDTDTFGGNLKITGLSDFGTKANIPGTSIKYVDPNIGSLILNTETGIITYDPQKNYNGDFSFNYFIRDAYGELRKQL